METTFELIPILVGFLLAIKLLMTLSTTIFSFRISRMSVTSTSIWNLWTGAFALITTRAIFKLFDIAQYTKEAEIFGIKVLFIELIFWNLIYVLMFAAVLKTYFELRAKFNGLD